MVLVIFACISPWVRNKARTLRIKALRCMKLPDRMGCAAFRSARISAVRLAAAATSTTRNGVDAQPKFCPKEGMHSKRLKKPHLVFFWLGLCMDTTGTMLMGEIAGHSMLAGNFSVHGVTGALAILLMIIHAIWATVVLVKNNEKATKNFHRFSILVWAIWLIPYIIGLIMGMGMGMH